MTVVFMNLKNKAETPPIEVNQQDTKIEAQIKKAITPLPPIYLFCYFTNRFHELKSTAIRLIFEEFFTKSELKKQDYLTFGVFWS